MARPTRAVLTKLKKPIQVSWAEVLQGRVEAANSFYFQVVTDQKGQPAELILNAGFLPPAPTWGESKDQLAQAEAISEVAVRPVARLTFSIARARELRDVLDNLVKALEG